MAAMVLAASAVAEFMAAPTGSKPLNVTVDGRPSALLSMVSAAEAEEVTA
mgnify:CR=1 FL=1